VLHRVVLGLELMPLDVGLVRLLSLGLPLGVELMALDVFLLGLDAVLVLHGSSFAIFPASAAAV
jgi:hypothetical protein